mgnify:CR=1 FL=1|uniref:DNA-directed RNA polymerase n=1 Tax=viral metagenome TaxID=1070528 RepID=A0A6C0FE54_9ZZZZ|tara:strand:- start:11659 stop:16191 length:4533 start_codon:yes stop_codon:yes gene_type:complete
MEDVSWKIINKYFQDNPYNLIAHHLDSYNNFFENDMKKVFKDNNPFRFIEKTDTAGDDKVCECFIYMGGREGNSIYYSKPIIYNDDEKEDLKYMYPNIARLRSMTYGINIYYDIVADLIYYENDEKKERTITLNKVFLCKFPIMLHSNLCILKSLPSDTRYEMGECLEDVGGYFIIDGNEKVLVSQEKFADNMLYIKKHNEDSSYEYSAEIRSVSEDPSKPIRTTSVNIVSESTKYTNHNIVVLIPNVRLPIPLFVVMRALGVTSDKDIIKHCILDLEKNKQLIDLFIPSIHDAAGIFTQQSALNYIKEFTKRTTLNGVLEILMDYFLPHIGTENFIDKAYFLGHMVYKLLRVYSNIDQPTDRDNFMYKRVELSGTLIYQLFREYYLIFKKEVEQKIDKEFYFHDKEYKKGKEIVTVDDAKVVSYRKNFTSLIEDNHAAFFKPTTIEKGIRIAFKGNWGATDQTKKIGVLQEMNRLSNLSVACHLRKFVLPLDPTAKVTGPRLLHASQWGYIDPVDTPDGGNCGLHKHMAISTYVTSGSSASPMIKWLRTKTTMKLLAECNSDTIASFTKMFVNGNWVGVLDNPLDTIKLFKLYRRSGLIPAYNSISFMYNVNEIHIYTDSGRLTRPLYYIENGMISYGNSPKNNTILKNLMDDKFSWNEIVNGFKDKNEDFNSINLNEYHDVGDVYPTIKKEMSRVDNIQEFERLFSGKLAVVDYLDTSEESSHYIATVPEDLPKSKYYSHLEIHPSLLLGILGNSIIFPEQNPSTRNAFSCGQSKQAVSMYHTNFQNRMDKMGVVLNAGQVPLVKSRYLKYINNERVPYGVNAIVAIMSYTSYNVEDAILINKGAVDRGLFRTTYYTTYEAREESSKISKENVDMKFADVLKNPEVRGVKPNHDYDSLNEYGLIVEETEMDPIVKKAVIGRIVTSSDITQSASDASVFPKRGQVGVVDKTFMTDGEEGTRIAKVRIREERIPAIGDKMASRAGQKGTIGLIIPEKDMPYASDGTVPDLIINPHAIPSRMTIGQLLEALIGKVDTTLGGFGDCTAFTMKGANTEAFGKILTHNGYHSSGNQVLYSGFTGEQLNADIFIGPTYYMRLKHMVKDKINYRATGPDVLMTRQPVHGRANDGGLRIGEMERDGIMAHGASAFLNDAFMNRADEYHMAICNKTGAIAAYNKEAKIMLSPHADGPLQFTTTLDGNVNLEKISHHGKSFSIVRIPYSFKLLLQELQAMNVHMKIITEDNIDHLTTMSYSDNINKLMKDNSSLEGVFSKLKTDIRSQMKNVVKEPVKPIQQQTSTVVPIPENNNMVGMSTLNPTTPPLDRLKPTSPILPPPDKESDSNAVSNKDKELEEGEILSEEEYVSEPVENKEVPDISKFKLDTEKDQVPQVEPGEESTMIKDPNIQSQFDALPEKDKMKLMKVVASIESEEEQEKRRQEREEQKKQETLINISTASIDATKNEMSDKVGDNSAVSILKVEKEKADEDENNEDDENKEETSGGGMKKTISFDTS